MTAAARPGWYADPAGDHDLFRWWDGTEWTEATSDSAQAPPPLWPEPGEPDLPRHRPLALRVLALGLGLALFVTAGVAMGLVIWREPTAESAGGPAADEVTPGQPTGWIDRSSRRATISSASMVLPDAPYRVGKDPVAVPGIFDVAFVASAAVHRRYDGSNSWSAAVALVSIDRSLASSSDLEQDGRAAVDELTRHFFGGHPTSLARTTSTEHAVDGRPGMLFTAEVHYRIHRLPSTYDKVTALVVRLDDGTMVAAISSVPNRAAPTVARQATTAVESLTVSS